MLIDKQLWDCFRWKAELIRVIDGDTAVVMAQISHNQFLRAYLRFRRINAKEIRGAEKLEGLASKEALVELLTGHEALYLEIYELDTFGSRHVAELYIEEDGVLFNVNDEMARAGFAAYAASRSLDDPAGWIMEV